MLVSIIGLGSRPKVGADDRRTRVVERNVDALTPSAWVMRVHE